MKNLKKLIVIIVYYLLTTNNVNSLENKILFKVNNEIITTLDISNELKYLKTYNKELKNIKKKQAFDIAKKSLIREKIKEIELNKVVREIKIEDQILNNILLTYFKDFKINSITDFENYFISQNINPDLIKKKITIEVLWNKLIFNKFNQSVKIDRQAIIKDLKKNNKQKEFFLSEILFDINENEKFNEKFNLIKNKINQTNFYEAALTFSISDNANKGGKLGWIKESALNKKIRNVLQDIKIGDYSKPLTIPGGFLILKVEDIRKVDINFELDTEVKKIITEKTNEQLNQFSNIFFNKVQKDVVIDEL